MSLNKSRKVFIEEHERFQRLSAKRIVACGLTAKQPDLQQCLDQMFKDLFNILTTPQNAADLVFLLACGKTPKMEQRRDARSDFEYLHDLMGSWLIENYLLGVFPSLLGCAPLTLNSATDRERLLRWGKRPKHIKFDPDYREIGGDKFFELKTNFARNFHFYIKTHTVPDRSLWGTHHLIYADFDGLGRSGKKTPDTCFVGFYDIPWEKVVSTPIATPYCFGGRKPAYEINISQIKNLIAGKEIHREEVMSAIRSYNRPEWAEPHNLIDEIIKVGREYDLSSENN